MNRTIGICLIILAFAAFVHATWWAFTGEGLVTPAKDRYDEGRIMLAAMLHVFAMGMGLIFGPALIEDGA